MLSGEVINNKYRLEKNIGKGAFGNVYKASYNGSSYAVKIVFSQNITDDVISESKLATQLKHANIIMCYEADKCTIKGAEYLYFLMELGEYSLRQRLDERVLDMDGEILKLASDIASGLSYLHSQNYIHRDIKPANILWCNNNWKISDFGTLRLMEQTQASRTSFAGTYAYVPPEGFRGDISTGYDLWSYGVLIMEARTSVRPFDTPKCESDFYRVVNNNKPNISTLLVSPLREIVEGCLQKDINSRWNINHVIESLGKHVYTTIDKSIPGQLIIESGIAKNSDYSYKDRTHIKSVILPSSVAKIGDWAFRGCKSLASITIPDSVTKIGDAAFQSCKSLASITIPKSVTKIGRDAFSVCTNLSSITVPKSVTDIGQSAFDRCKSLIISGYTASYLKKYTNENHIKSKAFNSIIDESKSGQLIIESGIAKLANYSYKERTDIKSVIIPKSVTEIGQSAFIDCESLESITIPDSVIEIGGLAFWNCTSLSSINIPKSVTKIGQGAFRGCTNLTSIIIPDSVTEIGEGAFRSCTSLVSITIPNSVTKIGQSVFDRCESLIISGYTATYAEKYANENHIEFKTLNSKPIPGQLIIEPGITKIADYSYINRTDVKSIVIPDSITEIGRGSFRGCKSLASITIPDSVTVIRQEAFCSCKKLESIAIPKSVNKIGKSAFYGCTRLKSITIPESVTRIGEMVFWGCVKLSSITIPDSIIRINESAFRNCRSLVISCYKDSYAEKYATRYGIKFITL